MRTYEQPLKNLYVALKSCDLCFHPEEVEAFIYLWNEGHALADIAKYLKSKYNIRRLPDEVALLAFDLSMKKAIKPRPNGIFSNVDLEGEPVT